MNRRDFLKTGAVLGGLTPLTFWGPASALHAANPPRVTSRLVPSLPIRDYLSREAQRITDGALSEAGSRAAWRRRVPEKRRQFLEMMGLDTVWTAHRPPPPVVVTGTVDRPAYRIEKLYYESLPRLFVTANLYLPKAAAGRVPGVLYVCGHSRDQKVHYQAHARRFAELGFACLLVETIQLGEVEGVHHGCYREGWWHWYSRGYTPAGIELLNGVRGLDLLAQRPEVDPDRLGVTGISGGGAASWWIAAADDRVRAVAPVCGTATLFSHIHDRTVDGHCDCMWWINTHRWDLADVGALIAPRALLIASADQDGIFTIESIRTVHAQLARLYRKLGAAPRLRLVETPGGHSYHTRSRTAIFAWFLEHLQDRPIPPEQVGDLDARPEVQESADTLRVYVHGPPDGNRTPSIHDDLRPPPPRPELSAAGDVEHERQRVIRELRRLTFAAFPATPPPLDLQIEHEFDENPAGAQFAYTSEAGWRLRGQWFRPRDVAATAPAVVALRSPREGRWDTRGFLLGLNVPGHRFAIAPRGTGDTSWGEDLDWHVRRAAAWTGRTVASMRVWDTLRALEAVRRLPGIDPAQLALAARGEMGVVALYAALLDGRARTVFLENPLGSQDFAGERDGRGPAPEMLNCLRITDVPHVTALLWPAQVVVIGHCPATFQWVEAVFARLGPPGDFRRIAEARDWRPPR